MEYYWSICLKCGTEAGEPAYKFDHQEDPKEVIELHYQCLNIGCDGKQKFLHIERNGKLQENGESKCITNQNT